MTLLRFVFLFLVLACMPAHFAAKEQSKFDLENTLLDFDDTPDIVEEAQARTEETLPDPVQAVKDNAKKNGVYLNFEGASLAHVLSYLAEKKDVNLATHKDLANAQVTLTTQGTLTLDEAWDILLTLLEANNFSLIEVDGLYRVVQKTISNQQPLPSYVGVDYDVLPDSDELIRYVYLFANIKAESVSPILQQMLAQNSVQVNSSLNAVVITEKSLSIRSAMKIIKELDMGGMRESIQIVELKESTAEDVAKTFTDLMGDEKTKQPRLFGPRKKKLSYFSSNTKIIPEPRNNTLIMLGTRQNLERIRTFITKYIDVPFEAPQSRLHIKELKYAEAEKVAPIIQAAITPPKQKEEGKGGPKNEVRYFEDMIVAAESSEEGENENIMSVGSGNRLIVSCTRDDWKRIERFIDKLDKPQPQVALEVLFVDVELNENKELGAQIRNKDPGQLISGMNAQTQHLQAIPDEGLDLARELQNNLISAPTAQRAAGAAWLTVGKATADRVGGLWGVVKSVLQTNNVNIISQPFLVAKNRKTSILEIVDERRVESQVNPNSTTAVRAQEPISAKITVELTPGINSDGIINLLIKINIDEFSSTTVTADVADRLTRFVETRTTMADGEVLVIGGLTNNTTRESVRETPILSKIPVLGNLFKRRSKTTRQANLTIFIRPSIIKPRFEGKPGDYTQLKLDYARLAIERSGELAKTRDPIQRWFFDTPGSLSYGAGDAPKDAEFKQIEDFTQAKRMPRSTMIAQDPYYKSEDSRTVKSRKAHKNRIGRELKKRK